jgi:hypothetical protein
VTVFVFSGEIESKLSRNIQLGAVKGGSGAAFIE